MSYLGALFKLDFFNFELDLLFFCDLRPPLIELVTRRAASLLKLCKMTLFRVERSIFDIIEVLERCGNSNNSMYLYSTILSVWAASRTANFRFSQDFSI